MKFLVFIMLNSIFLCSCKRNVNRSSSFNTEKEVPAKYFYKLVRCEKHLCIKSIIKDPGQVNKEKELKKFDSIKIQHCKLQVVPKFSTAECRNIDKFRSSGRSDQFSLVELEQQYLKQYSSKLLDNAVEMMSRFINESASCKASGFLNTHYGQSNSEVIGKYQKHYNAILNQIVPFFNVALNGHEEDSTSGTIERREGLGLVEDEGPGNGITATDRIRPGGRYTLDVIKFEPKVTIGLDITWPDAENFSIGNLSDVQDSVKGCG